MSEVDRRFGGANRNIICGIGALTPSSGQFLEQAYSSMTKFAEQTSQMSAISIDNIMPVFGENTSTLLDFCNFVSKYDDAFYELSRLLQIACTMPVTSLASKRSFSCLKLIKTHLRTTMLDERLASLAVLSMHSESMHSE